MRIVCAGAGLTSIAVAPYLKEHLPKASIVVISREIYHPLYSHQPELISGKTRLEHSTVNVEKLCKEHNVEFIKGTITHINKNTKTISVGASTVQYDYLLLDLGSEPDTTAVPGAEHALTTQSPLALLTLRQHIVTQIIKARNTNDAKHKAFVVAGAGVRAIELATEIQALIEHASEQHLIFKEELATILIEQGAPAETHWSTRIRNYIESALEARNIEYYKDTIHKYTPGELTLTDRTIETETLVWAAEKRANKLVEQTGLALDDHKAAWVNDYLQTSDPYIFAVGDDARLKQAKKPVPRTAFMSFDEQEAVAKNLIAIATGKPLKKYTPRTVVPILVTTGNNEALLILGPWSFYGKWCYKLKNAFIQKYARRIHKA